jgi:hypothetical protein
LQPKILLLDEPLSHLDAASRLELRTTIRRLVRETGLTVLCVLHDQKDALAMADHLAIMHRGKVVQTGAPLEVYRRPVDSWTATFLGAANLISGKILQVGAGEFVAQTELGEIHGALSPAAQALSVGNPVTICIRPECLKLDTMAPDENAFAGTVIDSLFQGDFALHDFQTKAGILLRLAEANPRHRLGSKMTYYAWVEPEDVVCKSCSTKQPVGLLSQQVSLFTQLSNKSKAHSVVGTRRGSAFTNRDALATHRGRIPRPATYFVHFAAFLRSVLGDYQGVAPVPGVPCHVVTTIEAFAFFVSTDRSGVASDFI